MSWSPDQIQVSLLAHEVVLHILQEGQLKTGTVPQPPCQSLHTSFARPDSLLHLPKCHTALGKGIWHHVQSLSKLTTSGNGSKPRCPSETQKTFHKGYGRVVIIPKKAPEVGFDPQPSQTLDDHKSSHH